MLLHSCFWDENEEVPTYQCYQMVRWVFQYLAIYSNENVPKSIQIVSKWVHHFAKYQKYGTLQSWVKITKFMLKWRNFAKSGHYCTYLPRKVDRYVAGNLNEQSFHNYKSSKFVQKLTYRNCSRSRRKILMSAYDVDLNWNYFSTFWVKTRK